jgi:hypothetical protein
LKGLVRRFWTNGQTSQRAPPVTDHWPEHVPVTEAEVDVFEAWFGDLFDEFFGPRG